MILHLLYIDPGSGSYIVQAIVAALLGIGFYFKNIMAVIRSAFYRLFRKNSEK